VAAAAVVAEAVAAVKATRRARPVKTLKEKQSRLLPRQSVASATNVAAMASAVAVAEAVAGVCTKLTAANGSISSARTSNH
jgi:hypothetical protein